MASRKGVARGVFKTAYKGKAPWDVDRPQPAIVRLVKAGAISGDVLDVGCGTGENALFLGENGFVVLGVDMVKKAIDIAKRKAAERRAATVDFRVADALMLGRLERTFDTVTDSGLLHVVS